MSPFTPVNPLGPGGVGWSRSRTLNALGCLNVFDFSFLSKRVYNQN